ncbi:hypothetical protein JCM8097_000727 [Rhodosporidiobolus ruineniae]
MADAAQDPPKKAPGLFDFTPEQQKKATLIFLVSLGTTLLVTGRSGGKLLKRAKASEGAAPPPRTPPTPAPATRALPPQPPRPTPPPPRPSPPPTTVKHDPVSLTLPQAPPASFLHPNSLTPPRPRRLLPSFVASPSSSSSDEPSILSSTTRPPPSAYFLPNPTLVSASTAYAKQLDRLDKLHEEGEADLPPPIEDGFNPAVYAMKALVIATALTVGTFGAGIYGLMKYLGADDLDTLALELSHRVTPFLHDNRPSVPAWALPSSSSSSTDSPSPSPDSSSAPASDPDASAEAQEELSYWASIKETLDREAEERKVERKSAWERMRRRAESGSAGNERAV